MMDQLYRHYISLKVVRTLMGPFDYQFITRYKLFLIQYDMEIGDRMENIGWLNEY